MGALIRRLAQLAGTPVFAPHITLAGAAVDGPALTTALAAFTPFNVTLNAVAHSDERFRCVTLTAEPDPTLLALRAALPGRPESRPYEPHLSLVYGELDHTTRTGLCAKVDHDLPLRVTIDRVQLVAITDDPSAWPVLRTWTL